MKQPHERRWGKDAELSHFGRVESVAPKALCSGWSYFPRVYELKIMKLLYRYTGIG